MREQSVPRAGTCRRAGRGSAAANAPRPSARLNPGRVASAAGTPARARPASHLGDEHGQPHADGKPVEKAREGDGQRQSPARDRGRERAGERAPEDDRAQAGECDQRELCSDRPARAGAVSQTGRGACEQREQCVEAHFHAQAPGHPQAAEQRAGVVYLRQPVVAPGVRHRARRPRTARARTPSARASRRGRSAPPGASPRTSRQSGNRSRSRIARAYGRYSTVPEITKNTATPPLSSHKRSDEPGSRMEPASNATW